MESENNLNLASERWDGSAYKKLLAAIVVSGGLHAGAIVGPKYIPEGFKQSVREFVSQIPVIRERIENFIVSIPRIPSELWYKNQLESADVPNEDLGAFFLQSEFYAGGIDEDELKEAQLKWSQLTQGYPGLAKNTDNLIKDINMMLSEFGEYRGSSSYLSHLLLDGKGNCEARAKIAISLVGKVYPELPTKLQIYRDHIRALVEIDGNWYVMEGRSISLVSHEELVNTVLADSTIFVDSYLGKEVEVEKIEVTGNSIRRKIQITDSPFQLLKSGLASDLDDYAPSAVVSGDGQNSTDSELSSGLGTLKRGDKDPFRVTILNQDQLDFALGKKNWYPDDEYEKLTDDQKRTVDLYRDMNYEEAIKGMSLDYLYKKIDRDAASSKLYRECRFGKDDRNIVNLLEEARKKMMVTTDIAKRREILCDLTYYIENRNYGHAISSDPNECGRQDLRIKTRRQLLESGIGIKIDNELSFFMLWHTMQSLCNWPYSEFGPEKEKCYDYYSDEASIDMMPDL